MRWNDLYIVGTGAALPARMPAERAVRQGLYPRQWWEQSGMRSACVADDGQSALNLSVSAARRALAQSGHRPAEIGLLLHSSVLSMRPEMWSPASALQKTLGASGAFACEVRAMCDGGMASLDLAAPYLTVRAPGPLALLTAGEVWPRNRINRWAYPSAVFADGAAAVLLSRTGGFARILATSSATDPELEGLSRGNQQPASGSSEAEAWIDPDHRAREFMAAFGRDQAVDRITRGAARAAHDALADAGTTIADIDRIIAAHLCHDQLLALLADVCPGTGLERTTWELGRTIGHLGPADQFADFDRLVRTHTLEPGQRALALGVGQGFVWNCAVIEILHRPRRRPERRPTGNRTTVQPCARTSPERYRRGRRPSGGTGAGGTLVAGNDHADRLCGTVGSAPPRAAARRRSP
ncbi:ketoacyl-ACP synthase III family protein [Streptomyces sp. NPDC020379]|uniref:ketoacyl-ACP synthase III family protein n=1 Tax=Streptomyces sp. NPDC020379 TaxID=3365071 RepID=UPI0037A82E1F